MYNRIQTAMSGMVKPVRIACVKRDSFAETGPRERSRAMAERDLRG